MKYLQKIAMQKFDFNDQKSNYGLELEVLFPDNENYKGFTKEFNNTVSEKIGVLDSDVSLSNQVWSWEIKMTPMTIFEIQAHSIWNLLKKYKAYVDESCGVHVSIPINYFTKDEWDKIRDRWNSKIQECQKSVDITGRVTNYHCIPNTEGNKGSSIHFDNDRAEIRAMAGTVDFETIKQYIWNIVATINNALSGTSIPYTKVNKNKYNIDTHDMKNILMNLMGKIKEYLNNLSKTDIPPSLNFYESDIIKGFLLETSIEQAEIKYAYRRLLCAIRGKDKNSAIKELNNIIQYIDKAVEKIALIDSGEFEKATKGGELIYANRINKYLRRI